MYLAASLPCGIVRSHKLVRAGRPTPARPGRRNRSFADDTLC